MTREEVQHGAARTADDARRNPKPGDVFKGRGRTREVTGVVLSGLPGVYVWQAKPARPRNGFIPMRWFVDWAATAEVLKVAE